VTCHTAAPLKVRGAATTAHTPQRNVHCTHWAAATLLPHATCAVYFSGVRSAAAAAHKQRVTLATLSRHTLTFSNTLYMLCLLQQNGREAWYELTPQSLELVNLKPQRQFGSLWRLLSELPQEPEGDDTHYWGTGKKKKGADDL
jgi:hypothetical protein